jgi:hypothetical protein
VSNKDTIIEALTIQLKIEREGNLALVNRIAELEKQEPLVWMNKYGHVASFKNDEYTAPLYIRPVVHAVRCTYPQCQATNGCVGVCSKGQAEKQEPVAWHEPGAYGNVTTHKDWALANGWLPLYKDKNT